MTKGIYKGDRYINFPIYFLKGFLQDGKGSRKDKGYINILHLISYYSAYKQTGNMHFGNYGEMMNSAIDFLGVDSELMGEHAYFEGRRLAIELDDYSMGKSFPMTGLKVPILQRFKYEHMSERQVVCLLAYLALKSIIGNKPYVKTTNRFWLSRMAGENKAIDADILLNIAPEVSEINTRRKLERLKNDLIEGRGLSYYGRATRGFYVSFSMPLDDLVFQAEKKRKTVKEKTRNYRVTEALIKANERLYGKDCK